MLRFAPLNHLMDGRFQWTTFFMLQVLSGQMSFIVGEDKNNLMLLFLIIDEALIWQCNGRSRKKNIINNLIQGKQASKQIVQL